MGPIPDTEQPERKQKIRVQLRTISPKARLELVLLLNQLRLLLGQVGPADRAEGTIPRLLSAPVLKVTNLQWFNGKPLVGKKFKVQTSKKNASQILLRADEKRKSHKDSLGQSEWTPK